MPVPPPVPPVPTRNFTPLPIPDADEDDEEEIDDFSSLTITESRPVLYFGESNIAIAYPTGFFADGRKSLIYDVLCRSKHRDYYRIVMGLGGTSFSLQARIPPSFLNITGRIENELDVRNPDTMVVVAATRRASDFLASVHGSDFDNLWTDGKEFPLAFKCLPNPHTQIIWHMGCPILHHERSQNPGLYLDATHQQMPILRVTFTSLEVQRMAALRSEDVVIVKSPTRNPMGFGLAPP